MGGLEVPEQYQPAVQIGFFVAFVIVGIVGYLRTRQRSPDDAGLSMETLRALGFGLRDHDAQLHLADAMTALAKAMDRQAEVLEKQLNDDAIEAEVLRRMRQRGEGREG